MITFDLLKTANQRFTTNLNNHICEFDLHTFRGITYCNVTIDGELIQAGAKGLPNRSIFTSPVNTLIAGVMKFVCTTDDYPYFSNFDGKSVIFAYIPNEEL